MRKYPSVSPSEFWKSKEKHTFRFNYHQHSEWRKFQLWILQEIEEKRNQESYDKATEKEFGALDFMEDYDKKYEVRTTCPLFKVNRQILHKDDKKWKPKSNYDYPFQALEELGDEYIIQEEV